MDNVSIHYDDKSIDLKATIGEMREGLSSILEESSTGIDKNKRVLEYLTKCVNAIEPLSHLIGTDHKGDNTNSYAEAISTLITLFYADQDFVDDDLPDTNIEDHENMLWTLLFHDYAKALRVDKDKLTNGQATTHDEDLAPLLTYLQNKFKDKNDNDNYSETIEGKSFKFSKEWFGNSLISSVIEGWKTRSNVGDLGQFNQGESSHMDMLATLQSVQNIKPKEAMLISRAFAYDVQGTYTDKDEKQVATLVACALKQCVKKDQLDHAFSLIKKTADNGENGLGFTYILKRTIFAGV